MKTAELNNAVVVHYTCKTSDGRIFTSKDQNRPVNFIIGEGKLLKSFENAVIGMKVNNKRTVKLSCDEAYGQWQKENLIEIEKKDIPDEIDLQVGLELYSKDPQGNQQVVKIHKIKDNTVLLDANHPLAGNDLEFEIELVEIK